MKNKKRISLGLLKPFDYLLIVAITLLSFLPVVVFTAQQTGKDGDRIAIVRIDGEEVDRFNLDQIDYLTKTYYPAEGQYNIIEIKDGRIRDKEDNSPDQIAVKTGWIDKNGQTSICLPHKLIIEIYQEGADDYFIY